LDVACPKALRSNAGGVLLNHVPKRFVFWVGVFDIVWSKYIEGKGGPNM
jgi:hypothetical protein